MASSAASPARDAEGIADVFVSYSRLDLERVRPLVARMERAGLKVWWDQMVPTGTNFRRVIHEALHQARCVVVIWSKHSIQLSDKRNWVLDEAAVGLERGNLVPVLIDPVAPPLGFRSMQDAKLFHWQGDDCPELYDVLRAIDARRRGPQQHEHAAAASATAPGTGGRRAPPPNPDLTTASNKPTPKQLQQQTSTSNTLWWSVRAQALALASTIAIAVLLPLDGSTHSVQSDYLKGALTVLTLASLLFLVTIVSGGTKTAMLPKSGSFAIAGAIFSFSFGAWMESKPPYAWASSSFAIAPSVVLFGLLVPFLLTFKVSQEKPGSIWNDSAAKRIWWGLCIQLLALVATVTATTIFQLTDPSSHGDINPADYLTRGTNSPLYLRLSGGALILASTAVFVLVCRSPHAARSYRLYLCIGGSTLGVWLGRLNVSGRWLREDHFFATVIGGAIVLLLVLPAWSALRLQMQKHPHIDLEAVADEQRTTG